MTTPQRTVLITGASSGIGEAFADVFASEGFAVVGVARREERLARVADRLRERHGVGVEMIPLDLSRRDAVGALCAEIDRRRLTIDALVNNAGYGVPGVYLASAWERHEAMLQLMVTAVAELSYRLLPGMIRRRYGRIINVASLAGLVPAPAGHTLYAASKAFLIRFSEALGHEVRADGVHVTALCPGFTYSEFHDVTGTREQVNRLPRWLWMDAPTVARQGFDAVMAGKPVYINGPVNRAIAAVVRYAPQPLVAAVGRRLGRAYRRTRQGSG
ncbi:MAG TPA: SDR family oxidoreductase [Vicinamibacterales bacterium]|nr:SDR family oxidoreductase [Vicinamibacterales bacterium]